MSTEQENYQQPGKEPVQPAPLSESELVRAKNPNPRANSNIEDGLLDSEHDITEVGTEITDGEAG